MSNEEKIKILSETDFNKCELVINRIYKEQYVKDLEQQNKKYKSVLDEIREYITEDLEEPDPEVYQEYTVDISWFTDLLQILDKVKE